MSDTEMPEDFWADKNGNRYDGNFDSQGEFNGASQYRLKSTVDVEMAEKDKTISGILARIEGQQITRVEWLVKELHKALSDNAPRIEQAQE